MNIRNIYSITTVTLLEMLRKGIFYLLLFFSAGIIIFSYYMNFFSLGSQAPIIKDFSLSSISFFSIILTIVLGVTLIPSEIENKTIYPIITKPVNRYEYILGKYLGIICLIAINLIILTLLLTGILLMKENVLNLGVLKAMILVLAQCMIIGSITVLLSLWVTPPVNFSLMALILIIGNLSNAYLGYLIGMMLTASSGVMMGLVYAVTLILQAVKIVLPTFAFFNIKDAIVHSYFVSNFYIFEVVLYSVLYTSFILLVSYIVFEEKDL